MADHRRVSWDEVVAHFQELEDPRSTINQRHPLVSVLVIALLAVLAGAAGPTAIARWAALKEGREQRAIHFPDGMLEEALPSPVGDRWQQGQVARTVSRKASFPGNRLLP